MLQLYPSTLESESERNEELEREALARIHSYSNLFLRQVTMVMMFLMEMVLKVMMVVDQNSHQVKAAVHELAARLSKP